MSFYNPVNRDQWDSYQETKLELIRLCSTIFDEIGQDFYEKFTIKFTEAQVQNFSSSFDKTSK